MQRVHWRRYLALVVMTAVVSLLAAIVRADDEASAADTPTPEKKTTFAVIGDFGNDSEGQASVVQLIKTKFEPDFIVTVGDNNYGPLTQEGYDTVVGKYFHEYIGNYTGKHGDGAKVNRFFPALGNHDWNRKEDYKAYTTFFTLPGNERYYDFTQGDAHFFIVNSDPHEPDGREEGSTQYEWLKAKMNASTATWKFVFMHHPPYSSSTQHGSEYDMRWPFAAWGADAVFAGHDHTYERMDIDGTPYFICGLGGMSKYEFGDKPPHTAKRHNATFGAMRVMYDANEATFEFWSVAEGGTRFDTLTISANATKPEAKEPETKSH